MNALDILESTLRHKIDDVFIDYQIRFDITGKVYEVKPLVYDLPLNGQRIMLGGNMDEMKFKIERFQNLLELILPLGLVNQATFFAEELKNVYAEANQYIEKHSDVKDKLLTHTIDDSFIFHILYSASTPSVYPGYFHEALAKTVEIINNRNGDWNPNELGGVGAFYFPNVGFKIVSLLIPFINKPNGKARAYQRFRSCTDEACKNYLLQEMDKCQDGGELGGIFYSLSKQAFQDDDDIQTKLLNIYYSDIKLSVFGKRNLINILKRFNNEKSIEISLEIMNGFEKDSETVIPILLEMGYPVAPIAKLFLPKFYTTDIQDYKLACKVFLYSVKFSDYLPSSKDLVQAYVNTFDSNHRYRETSLPTLIINKKEEQSSSYIIEHLSNENPNVLEGILWLINALLYQPGIDNKPFISDKSKKRYVELIEYLHRGIFASIVQIVEKIGMKEDIREFRVLSTRIYEG